MAILPPEIGNTPPQVNPSQVDTESDDRPAQDNAESKCELVDQLLHLAAYCKDLESQSHIIHLNLEGPFFIPLHEYLKDRYIEHLEQFDTCAEAVRKLDFFVPFSMAEILSLSSVFGLSGRDATSMLHTYIGNIQRTVDLAGSIEPIAQCIGAIDIADDLAAITAQLNKTCWFLKATLRGCG